jgi:hypothetical protein
MLVSSFAQQTIISGCNVLRIGVGNAAMKKTNEVLMFR